MAGPAAGQRSGMSTPADLLLDGYGRLPDLVRAAGDGLSTEQLAAQLDPGANTVGWLLWHLARVEDESVAEAFGSERIWTAQGWSARFGLPFAEDDFGYGHSSEQVAAVRVESADLLIGYYDAVSVRTREHVSMVTGDDLDRVLDSSYDPSVTLGVRLVSVLEDAQQHVGQAALIRGILQRTGR